MFGDGGGTEGALMIRIGLWAPLWYTYSSGLSILAPKRLTFSIMVGLYKPQAVKGYLVSYWA